MGCVLALAAKDCTLTKPPVAVCAELSASVIPAALTVRSPSVRITAPLAPIVVRTVGVELARAVLDAVTWMAPPALVSRLLVATLSPSESTESSGRRRRRRG